MRVLSFPNSLYFSLDSLFSCSAAVEGSNKNREFGTKRQTFKTYPLNSMPNFSFGWTFKYSSACKQRMWILSVIIYIVGRRLLIAIMNRRNDNSKKNPFQCLYGYLTIVLRWTWTIMNLSFLSLCNSYWSFPYGLIKSDMLINEHLRCW